MKQHPVSHVAVCGALAGLVAGAVVALWFFVVDLAVATAFDTPARLGSLWLNEAYSGDPSARLVVIYTVLHFAAFAAIGLGVAVALRALDIAPGLLVGAFVGVGVLNGVYYGGRLAYGADLLNVLPWTHVLGANLLGGMLMMGYLHRALAVSSPLGVRVLERSPLLLKGLRSGVLGAVAVAIWFLVVDVINSAPFFTPAALGSVLFLGADGPTAIEVNLAVVGAYSVLHVLAFWAIGTAFVWVAERVEQAPGWWLVAVLSFVVLEALFVGVVGLVSGWVLGAIGWVSVGIGNVIAVIAMGWWVWATHPVLRRRLSEPALDTRV